MKNTDVLIIDDNEICCLMLQQRLKQLEIVASYILHSTKSIHLIEQTQPKLIVLDMYIPDRDGFEINNELQKKLDQPYIIAISQNPVALECIQHLGANEVFLKKDIELIIQAVKNYFMK